MEKKQLTTWSPLFQAVLIETAVKARQPTAWVNGSMPMDIRSKVITSPDICRAPWLIHRSSNAPWGLSTWKTTGSLYALFRFFAPTATPSFELRARTEVIGVGIRGAWTLKAESTSRPHWEETIPGFGLCVMQKAHSYLLPEGCVGRSLSTLQDFDGITCGKRKTSPVRASAPDYTGDGS